MQIRVALAALLLAACPGNGEDTEDTEEELDPLECEWFSSDNCWKGVVTAALSCAPGDLEDGTFDAGRTTCTFTDGTSISFAAAVPSDSLSEYEWEFTVEAGGSTCLSYAEDDTGSEVVTSEGTFTEDLDGFGMTITCPDGEQRHASNALDLFECDFATLPGYATSLSMGSVSFSLLGGPDGSAVLFRCGDP